MYKYLAVALLLVGAAVAQDAGAPAIGNRLPALQVANHDIGTLLTAASTALAAGQTGQAQEALEEAETRALDRSVPYNDYNKPVDDPLIDEITEARQALGRGDKDAVQRLIEAAQARVRMGSTQH